MLTTANYIGLLFGGLVAVKYYKCTTMDEVVTISSILLMPLYYSSLAETFP